MSDYTLDATSAKAADVKFCNIETSGAYMGIFTRAEKVTSEKGTKGVDLSFKANGGEQADYLTLWTHNKDGEALQGFKTLNAIMTCLRAKTLSAVNGEVEKYVKAQNGRAKVTVPLFRELMDKPIGLLIQMEESEYQGKRNWKPVIYAAFDKDEFTASEILAKATAPTTLAKMASMLKDKPLKGGVKPASSAHSDNENPGAGMDDPFADTPFL